MNRRASALLIVGLLGLGAAGLAASPRLLDAWRSDEAPQESLQVEGFDVARAILQQQYGVALQGAAPDSAEGLSAAFAQQHRNLVAAQRLAAIKDADLPPDEAALRYVEEISRHQLASLGMAWPDEVFTPDHPLPGEAVRALAERHGGFMGPEQEAALAAMDALPPEVAQALADVVDAFHAMDLAAEQAMAGADSDLLAALQAGDAEAGSLAEAGVDLSGVFAARLGLVEAAYTLKGVLGETGVEVPSLVVPAGHSSDPDTEFDSGEHAAPASGVVCIDCHDGENIYTEDFSLLIDTSQADNSYHNNAGGQADAGASALIDFGGSDHFGDQSVPRSGGANGGSGNGGVGFLLSMGDGDDEYVAGDGGVNGGARASSMGFLLDEGGDDTFQGGSIGVNGGAQGGIGAVGFLLDLGGDDVYEGESSGVNGGVGGRSSNGLHVGLFDHGTLLDVGGNDIYRAEDIAVNGGSHGQGAVGFLVDLDGDDAYEAGDTATNGGAGGGAGYAPPSGFLLDWTGTDSYKAGRGNVNGGSHVAAGLLADLDGAEDLYLDDSIRSGSFQSCLVSSLEDCSGEAVEAGACFDCTLLLKGVPSGTASTLPGIGIQIDLVSDPEDLAGVIQTDCAEPNLAADGRPCWLQIGDINATIVGPYFKEGNGQVGAVGDPLPHPLMVYLPPQLLSDEAEQVPPTAHRACFELFGGPNGEGDLSGAQLEAATPAVTEAGAPPDAVCTESDETGRAGVRMRLGSQVGTYVVRAWNQTVAGVGQGNGFVEFRVEAKAIDRITIQQYSDGLKTDIGPGGASVKAGNELKLFAAGYAVDGQRVSDVEVTWSVDDEAHGNFTSEVGLTTGFTGKELTQGHPATITASRPGQADATARVEVLEGDPAEIRILDDEGKILEDGDLDGIPGGVARTLHAALYDAGGNYIELEDSSWESSRGKLEKEDGSFYSSSTEVKTIVFTPPSDAGLTGTITVSSERNFPLFTSSLSFSTLFGPLNTFEVRDAPGNTGGANGIVHSLGPFHAGNKTTLYVAGFDPDGNYRGDVTSLGQCGASGLCWDLDGLGSIEGSGDGGFVFTAETVGKKTIRVSHSGISHTVSIPDVEVFPGNASVLSIVPQTQVVTAGDPFGFQVLVEDAFGNHNTTYTGNATRAGLAKEHNVTIELEDNGEGLTGDLIQPATESLGGVATFDGLRYNTAGTITIVATLPVDGGEPLEGRAEFTVVPAALDSIKVKDSDGRMEEKFQVFAGDPLVFRVAGFDEFGNRRAQSVPVEWSLAGVGTITTDGQGQVGGTFLSATFQSQSKGSATLRADPRVPGVAAVAVDIQVVPDKPHQIRVLTAPGGSGDVVEGLGTLQANDTVRLFAAGYDEHGNYINDYYDLWSVDPPHLGSFDASGTRFTAERVGTGSITVHHPSVGQDVVLDVTVVPGEPTQLLFTQGPPEETLFAGEEWPVLTVRVEDTFGNLVTQGTHEVTLQVGPGFEGRLDGTLVNTTQGGTTMFRGISYPVADTVWIVAEADGLQGAANGPYVVEPMGLHSLTVRSAAAGGGDKVTALDLTAGDQVLLHAAARDPYGNLIEVDPTWERTGVGRISATGDRVLFIAGEAGRATLTASEGGLREAVEVTVSPGPLDRIEVRAGSIGSNKLVLPVGEDRVLQATGFDAWGNRVGGSFTWSIDPPGLGTLSENDSNSTRFTAKDSGRGVVTVQHGNVTATLHVDAREDVLGPQAAFVVTCAGLACAFDASGSTPGDAAIARHTWDFGDGTLAEGANRTHTYAEAGQYPVTLVVTDLEGITDETTLEATPTPPPRPDIRLHVGVWPEKPVAGDAIEINVTVENVGTAPASDVTVVFLVNGERIHAKVEGDLAPGASRRTTAHTNTTAGEHTLRVEALGWGEETVPLHVVEPDRQDATPRAEAPAAGLVFLVAALAVALWAARRR